MTWPRSHSATRVPSTRVSSNCAGMRNAQLIVDSAPGPVSSRQASRRLAPGLVAGGTTEPSQSAWLAATTWPSTSATTARRRAGRARARPTRKDDMRPSMSPVRTSCIGSRLAHSSASW